MKRSPSALRRIPPSPRTASVTSVPADVLGRDHARRVELDELHVAQAAARVGGEAHRVAGVLVAARGRAAPDPRVAAGGEDHRVGEDRRCARAVVDVEAVGAEDAAVVDEQPGDVDVVAHLHAELRRPAHERALDLAAGVVAGEAGAAVGVRAEVALGEPAVWLAGEAGAVGDEILDGGGRLAGEQLDDRGVGEVVGLGDRVGGVLLPGVLGVHGAQRGVDAAGGEHGVRVVAAALADAQHLVAGLGELDGGPQAGGAGADDEDAGGGAAGVWGAHTLSTVDGVFATPVTVAWRERNPRW